MKIYKFSETATETPTLAIDNPRDFLGTKYTKGYIFGLDNLQRDGIYRLMGWAYDFRPYLKKYLVKQYGQWHEYYAPNKTKLKNILFGRIDKIQELI